MTTLIFAISSWDAAGDSWRSVGYFLRMIDDLETLPSTTILPPLQEGPHEPQNPGSHRHRAVVLTLPTKLEACLQTAQFLHVKIIKDSTTTHSDSSQFLENGYKQRSRHSYDGRFHAATRIHCTTRCGDRSEWVSRIRFLAFNLWLSVEKDALVPVEVKLRSKIGGHTKKSDVVMRQATYWQGWCLNIYLAYYAKMKDIGTQRRQNLPTLPYNQCPDVRTSSMGLEKGE